MLGKAIYYILSNDATITGLVGANITPTVAEQGTEPPVIVYKLRHKPQYMKSGLQYDESQCTIMAMGNTYEGVGAIVAAIRGAMENIAGVFSGIQIKECRITDIDEDFNFDDNLFAHFIEFTIKHKTP